MAFTSHGHHIPGTVLLDLAVRKARCGGPGLCVRCSMEVKHARDLGVVVKPEEAHESNSTTTNNS